MTESAATERAAWAIPSEALTEWLRLAERVDEIGAVPCRTSDPEAWWPERTQVDDRPARMARDACSVCDARDACLDYALAAGETAGIWGALTAAERGELGRELAGEDFSSRADEPIARPHGEERTYSSGCRCSPCRRAHAQRIADWRARRRYAETDRAA